MAGFAPITDILKAPEELDLQLRQQLEQWLDYRRNGREGVEAGRTVSDALEEIEKLGADRPDKSEELEEIRRWLTGAAPVPLNHQ